VSRASKRWEDFVRRAEVRHYGGIDLCIDSPFGDRERDELLFQNLEKAVCLVYEVQPWRSLMVPRHLQRILSVYPLGAEYVASIEACVVGYEWLEAGNIEEVAKSIIHELTHARIEHCGIPYTEDLRARIEYLCLKAELNFALAAEGAARLTRGQMPVIEPWWTEEHRVKRHVEQLRALGAPEWLISAALLVYRIRRWSRRGKKDSLDRSSSAQFATTGWR
jgi:hypothetical protein